MAEETPQAERPLGFFRSKLKQLYTDPSDKIFNSVSKPVPETGNVWKDKLTQLKLDLKKDPFRNENDFMDFKRNQHLFFTRNKTRPIPYTGANVFAGSCLGGSIGEDSFCDKIEMRALECVEYYGVSRGLKICSDYYDDYMECTLLTKQTLYLKAMARKRSQRYNEYLLGKRDYDSVYERMPNPLILRNITSAPEFRGKN